MIAHLTWTPAANGGSQTIQYKKNNESIYTTFATVVAIVGSIDITTLDYNTIYNFKIINNCSDGTQEILLTKVLFTCPQITVTPSDTTAYVQFFDLGGSVDKYIVDLINPFTNTILDSKALLQPFASIVSTTFTGLTALTQYVVRVKPNALLNVKSDCATVSFTTNNTAACPIPSSLSVTFS